MSRLGVSRPARVPRPRRLTWSGFGGAVFGAVLVCALSWCVELLAGTDLPAGTLLRGSAVATLLGTAGGVIWACALSGQLRRITEGTNAVVRDKTWGAPVPAPSLGALGALAVRLEALRGHFVASLEREQDDRQRAERADRFRTEFLTTVSHELRTPLNAILGFADVLQNELDGPLNEAQRESLQIIAEAGQNLMALFSDVLDLSAAASGHLRLKREDVDVTALLRSVRDEVRGAKGGRPIEIRTEIEGSLPTVHADRRRLRQIVTNLASNAVKFTEEGEVLLSARAEGGDHLVLSVRDTGPGIAPEEIERIFEEFHQVNDEAPRRRGAGLGLAITRQLTALHGGRLEVTSRLGEGSDFRVILPCRGGAR